MAFIRGSLLFLALRESRVTYYKWLTREMTSAPDCRHAWRVGAVHRSEDDGEKVAGAGGRGLRLLKDPVDALRFGQWPGRLFEAEPVGPVTMEDRDTAGCWGARLLREMDPAMVFGPNGVRVAEHLSRLKGFFWLRGKGEAKAAIDAAAEHQARLAPWGWKSVPVSESIFHDWGTVAGSASSAVNPAAQSGSWTAWAETGYSWRVWTAPWAAWAAWNAAWTGLERGAGSAAWATARERWKGPVPWPDPSEAAWVEAARILKAGTRAIGAAAADHAATEAEYLVCGGGLPPDPFEPLMEIWEQGYWPVGVMDGRYVIGDLSLLCCR